MLWQRVTQGLRERRLSHDPIILAYQVRFNQSFAPRQELTLGRQTTSHFFECPRKLPRTESRQSQTFFPAIEGGQPKAAIFHRQAKEGGNGQVRYGRKQTEAGPIG